MEINTVKKPHNLHSLPPAADGAVVFQVEGSQRIFVSIQSDKLQKITVLRNETKTRWWDDYGMNNNQIRFSLSLFHTLPFSL